MNTNPKGRHNAYLLSCKQICESLVLPTRGHWHHNHFTLEEKAKGTETMAIFEGFLEVNQLAARIPVCDRTLRRWILEGNAPPYIKLGRKTLFREEAVREWLLSRECSRDERTRQRRQDAK